MTDADIVLGYMNPDNFLGGEMRLDPARAREALIRRICEPVGLSLEEAAWGAYKIVNAHMADLVRQASVERGHDPRDFLLVAIGGCGPTHCTGYGPEIGTKSIVVPLTAPVFSALGIIAQSDIKHFYSRSLLIRMHGSQPPAAGELASLNETLRDLMARGQRQFAEEGVVARDTVILRPSIELSIDVEEANHALWLRERLNQPIAKDRIKATVTPTNAALVVFVEGVHERPPADPA